LPAITTPAKSARSIFRVSITRSPPPSMRGLETKWLLWSLPLTHPTSLNSALSSAFLGCWRRREPRLLDGNAVSRARLVPCRGAPHGARRHGPSIVGAGTKRGKGLDLLDDIGAAAVAGRVRRLWLNGDRPLCGHADPATGRILQGAQDDDGLEALAEIVLSHAGEVRIVGGRALPSESGAAAELR
jgi:hypothetical protein